MKSEGECNSVKLTDLSRRDFVKGAVACAGLSVFAGPSLRAADKMQEGIQVRFLGSGCAKWDPAWLKSNPFVRRQASVLIDDRVLIDFTACGFDMLPEGCCPEALFLTHSHGDHYNPDAIVRVGVKSVYAQETWAAAARKELSAAAQRLSRPVPAVIALPFGQAVETCGLRVTGVPANHSTGRVTDGVLERTSIYLVEKGPSRLLYATDTGGIPGDAARMIGIYPHYNERNWRPGNPFVARPQPLTGLIMEATNGAFDEDYRMFFHSSVQTVARTVNMLSARGLYVPTDGQSAYLTHLGGKYRKLPAEQVDAELPPGIRAASDGQVVTFK